MRRWMLASRLGRTETYNLIKDPGCEEPRTAELRGLHEETDGPSWQPADSTA
ncbi:hypothetical protein [Sorangium sp. So ce1000]|uniref:hypothetical protein n=1 Tax=Sorangium sp. So ce1000 TaxID=3133325 RepID=UPI003F5E7ABF